MLQRDHAETVALQALGWLLGEPEMIGLFLNSTGASPSDLTLRAQDPDFLAAVLDFLLMDDAWVGAFCAAAALDPALPAAARAALPGGSAVHWT